METTAAHGSPSAIQSVSLHCERPDLADDELARVAQTGGAGALEALARRYRGRVYVFALALLQRPDDAEDVAQETFVRAFRGLHAYEPRGHFRTWLFGIAANVCREHRRDARRRTPVGVGEEEAELLEGQAPDTGTLYEQAALKVAVRAAIARFPDVYRAPVVLYYLEDLSIAEVAVILGRSRSSVKMQLWRARALLARELAG